MKLDGLVGRDVELRQLKDRWKLGGSSLVVCKGRRRIGKSVLIEEFGKTAMNFLEFQGLAPREGTQSNNQLRHFAEQLAEHTQTEPLDLKNWTQAFTLLNSYITSTKTVILLDEISWMAENDLDFAGKLKVAWDTQFKKHRNLIVVVCGSVSSWIETNILKNADFVGRVDLTLQIDELSIRYLDLFWGKRRSLISSAEKFRVLGVTGGVPKYLEEIDPSETAEQNIQRICFSPSGFLFNDFGKIFNEVFDRRAETYRKIIEVLVDGKRALPEISKKLGVKKGGTLLSSLDELELSGFIAKDFVYGIKDGRQTKLNRYRLKDNFLRFFLKYVKTESEKIRKGRYRLKALELLPNWETIMGLQFQNTVLANIDSVLEELNIDPNIVVSASPYFQKKKARNKGSCEIDLLIATRSSVYLCEMKFRKKIGIEVVKEVGEKARKLERPKNLSVRPVLIYQGELSGEVPEADFFSKIIEAEQFLKKQ